MAATQHGAGCASEAGQEAAEGTSIVSVPADVLFTRTAGDVLGDVAALRTSCGALRRSAAVVVANAAQSAHLHVHHPTHGDHQAHALGAALGSALSECQQPKHLSTSISSNCASLASAVLEGMHASGAHQHVAALLLHGQLPMYSGLLDWPHLHTLEMAGSLRVEPASGSSLAQLTRPQPSSLVPIVGDRQPSSSVHTLNVLKQLTQLTSLSLDITNTATAIDEQGVDVLFGSAARLPQLRTLYLDYAGPAARELAAGLGAVLHRLTALTSLDVCVTMARSLVPAAATALLRGVASLPALQHVGLPLGLDIFTCAHALRGLTALSSLRLFFLGTHQEPRAAQLLSQLTRLQLSSWHGRELGDLPEGRASWLAQLQEVAVQNVHLRVLAALPPAVCIKALPERPSGSVDAMVNIIHTAGTTEQEVHDAVARLHSSPAVKSSKSTMDVDLLRPEHCAAIKPLAEAVSRVHGLHPNHLPQMAGWRLRCLIVSVRRPLELPQFTNAVGAVEGLCVETLEVHWGSGNGRQATDQGKVRAVTQLCRSLRGLRLVESSGPKCSVCSPEVEAQCEEEGQRLSEFLQQAVQGRDVVVVRV